MSNSLHSYLHSTLAAEVPTASHHPINIPCHLEPAQGASEPARGNKGKCYKITKTRTPVIFFLMLKPDKRHFSNITKGNKSAAKR